MKVFLVENSYGSYDSFYTSVDKIFKTRIQTEDYITKVREKIKELKVLYDNLSDDRYDKTYTVYYNVIEQFNIDFPDTIYDISNSFRITERELE